MTGSEVQAHMREVKGSRRKFHRPALLALILILLVSPQLLSQEKREANAQPSSAAEEQDIDEGDVVSVSTSEVLLPVTVRDQNGRLVPTLTRKDFRVFEEGREQPLSDLALR